MSAVIRRLRGHFQSTLSVGTEHTLVSDPSTTLCTACAMLDFKNMLSNGLPETKKVPLGTLLDITKKSDHCAFCRLVADLVQRRWRLSDFPGTDLQATNCFVFARDCGTLVPDLDKGKRAHRLYIHASPRPLNISLALASAKAVLYLDIQLLEEDSGKVGRSKDLHGRRLKDKVDIPLIKRWIYLCERAHGETCSNVWWKSGDEDLPDFVRVLDVNRMALVRAGRDCRYVVLSYVWGRRGEDYWTSTANVKARSRPSGLEESALPATIVDAIQLTRQIGERYLWVDVLCIVEDSEEDKAVQIWIMDRIYSRAALTIFAMDGLNVQAGLPGVRGRSPTLDQHVECIQGLHLSIPLPPLMEVIAASTWDTRGWTFQEGLLSRRRLYFTKHQVYFGCSRDVWCEDLVAESKTLQGSFQPMRFSNTNLFPFTPHGTIQMNYRGYEEAVEEYTQRHLTVESDILHAITALTTVLTRALEPFGSNPRRAFRFGMWIRNLDLSLLWQPRLNAAHIRRVMVDAEHSRWPSWAWSGWKGAVQYQLEAQMLEGRHWDVHPLPAESLVTAWNVVDEDGTIVRLDVDRIPPSWNVGEIPPEKYTPSKSYPSDLVLEVLPPPGTLVFRTQCAPFRVLKLDDGALADPSQATAHTLFHIVPPVREDRVSPHDDHAGRIVLPVSTPSPTTLEFVVLSRCDGTEGLWDESVWGGRYYGCMLHVMAVRRLGTRDDARVSERVGIGVVVESAWLKSGAEERVVLLA